jgi:hypothetical protein
MASCVEHESRTREAPRCSPAGVPEGPIEGAPHGAVGRPHGAQPPLRRPRAGCCERGERPRVVRVSKEGRTSGDAAAAAATHNLRRAKNPTAALTRAHAARAAGPRPPASWVLGPCYKSKWGCARASWQPGGAGGRRRATLLAATVLWTWSRPKPHSAHRRVIRACRPPPAHRCCQGRCCASTPTRPPLRHQSHRRPRRRRQNRRRRRRCRRRASWRPLAPRASRLRRRRRRVPGSSRCGGQRARRSCGAPRRPTTPAWPSAAARALLHHARRPARRWPAPVARGSAPPAGPPGGRGAGAADAAAARGPAPRPHSAAARAAAGPATAPAAAAAPGATAGATAATRAGSSLHACRRGARTPPRVRPARPCWRGCAAAAAAAAAARRGQRVASHGPQHAAAFELQLALHEAGAPPPQRRHVAPRAELLFQAGRQLQLQLGAERPAADHDLAARQEGVERRAVVARCRVHLCAVAQRVRARSFAGRCSAQPAAAALPPCRAAACAVVPWGLQG